jgi:hypothetical protein
MENGVIELKKENTKKLNEEIKKLDKAFEKKRKLFVDKGLTKSLNRLLTSKNAFNQRLKYRVKFIERNEEFKKILEEIERETSIDIPKEDEPRREQVKRIVELGGRLFPNDPIIGAGLILRLYYLEKLEDLQREKEQIQVDSKWGLYEYMAENSMSPIEIVYNDGKKIFGSTYLNNSEPWIFKYTDELYNKTKTIWKEEREDDERTGFKGLTPNSLALDAVNKEERTITIKIHLDRQKEEIKKQMDFLFELLEWEAEYLEEDLGASKRPQWDVYDRYLQVYDLRKANPKMKWDEIAKRVFPEEIERERKAAHRKIKKGELATDSAVNKVFRYWKEANKMIDKGGWKQI